jgi:hypothetical protein
MNTPLRNILTWRGLVSGAREALATATSVDDNSVSLVNQLQQYHQAYGYMIESSLLNAGILALTLYTMMDNVKIRPWKQYSRTKLVVKSIVIFLLCFLAKNVEIVL